MGTTLSNILLHIVFSTKDRRPLITPDLRERLYPYLGGIVKEHNVVSYAIGGTEDHVHLLIRWNTTDSVSKFLQGLKGSSSRWISETFPGMGGFSWQRGYAVFSVSQSQCARVTQYIDNQETHHKKQSFQEELRQLLDAHGISYEERYLWG